MTDTQLTTLSTLVWLIGTIVLFILLAHWSAGGSWGISSAIARGLTGWAGRGPATAPGVRSGEDVRPMQAPRLDRLWAGHEPPAAVPTAQESTAVIEELGERRLQ